jgi:hypothetical protein
MAADRVAAHRWWAATRRSWLVRALLALALTVGLGVVATPGYAAEPLAAVDSATAAGPLGVAATCVEVAMTVAEQGRG